MELHFTVWQFVRLMVHLESHANTDLAPWAEIWSNIDSDLCALAQNDEEAYSDMMMNQDVIIKDASQAQAKAAAAALKKVMDELDLAIAKAAMDPQSEHQQSLKFERRELRQLARKFKQQGQDA